MNSSKNSIPTSDDDESDMLAELTSLLDRANSRVTDLAAKQAELDQLVQLPPLGAVTAVFDERGLLASLEIDAEARNGLEPQGLVHDINLALARAERSPATTPADTRARPEESVGLIESIFAGLTSGLSSEPVVYSNDLATVTVTTMWGEVLSVDCAATWVTASSTASISSEIVRVVNLAVRADDPLNRRKD